MKASGVILDSSVVAKWFFPEEHSKEALRVKDDFSSNALTVSVPLLLYYEINNLLKTATKSFRINAKDALDVYEAFLKLDFIVYSSEDLMTKALKKAIEFDISSYDASYIVLADYLEKPFYTADQKLLSKIKSKFIFDIKNYV